MKEKYPKIKLLRLKKEDKDVPLPEYMTPLSAGMDISAAVAEDIVIPKGKIVLVPSGFAIAIPEGFEAEIRPRSGLALKHGITLINSPGTIDADYRGEIKIPLINLGEKDYIIKRGDRIAQMLIKKVYNADIELVDKLDETSRNEEGFGHTGR